MKRYEQNKNILLKKGDEKWKKSKIIRYKDTPLFQFAWDYIDYEPKFDFSTQDFQENSNDNLIGFWTAIARIQDGELYMGRYLDSKPIVLTDKEKESIIKLNSFRNDFEHFIPTSWSIEIDLLKNICSDIINIIERITQTFEFIYLPSTILLDKNDYLIKELKLIFKI